MKRLIEATNNGINNISILQHKFGENTIWKKIQALYADKRYDSANEDDLKKEGFKLNNGEPDAFPLDDHFNKGLFFKRKDFGGFKMPDLKTYDLFISHSWSYNEDYYRLINLLTSANNFKYRNYSVPEHDPVIDPNSETGKRKLKEAIDRQIKPVNCVLIISGMYVSYSYWIQAEIDIALKYNKLIIGLIPRGQ